ncbi:hypothetical protein [[Phormidium] sp. ETS-05]|uniref:hypothetical protein n=1 Tax=[Phormidium] sp. ETS-05 TaxID=222819 RepID=UPI0018EEE4F9|nr:hypothetical protein [[Phormidium] sp. ETS-05]
MADTNRFNFHKHLKPVRLALAGILALMLVLVTGIHSYAAMPEAAIIAGKYGSDLFVGTGTEGERIAAQLNNQLRGNSILYVPGGNRGWAHLDFVFDWPLTHAGLLVKAGIPIISPRNGVFLAPPAVVSKLLGNEVATEDVKKERASPAVEPGVRGKLTRMGRVF